MVVAQWDLPVEPAVLRLVHEGKPQNSEIEHTKNNMLVF